MFLNFYLFIYFHFLRDIQGLEELRGISIDI